MPSHAHVPGTPGVRARPTPGRGITLEFWLMTQSQLDTAVAMAIGESLEVVLSLGFSLVVTGRDGRDLEASDLVLDCPTCGQPVTYPGRASDGSQALAECVRCDIYFAFPPEAV